MTSNPQETLQNLIQKYNLIKVNEGTYDEFYRPPFPNYIKQCGYLLRFDKFEKRLIIADSVVMNLNETICYQSSTDYDPYLFEILIKNCYNILRSIKESQLQKKLKQIDKDF